MANLTTLFSFNGTNGTNPDSQLVADAQGDLFGTVEAGGASSDGTVFEIVKSANGYASAPTTIASFSGPNGGSPGGALLFDAAGDLFGTTLTGTGATADGTVYEIAKVAGVYASAPVTLAVFTGPNGYGPSGALTADAQGNLFGTTAIGGANGFGTVFEIAKTGLVYASVPTTLVSFTGANNGSNPYGSVLLDANGDLFVTTEGFNATIVNANYNPFGNYASTGTVSEIVKTGNAYATVATTLVTFTGADGRDPIGDLITDANGDLFGTTTRGGMTGAGTVFEIPKLPGGAFASTPTILVSFTNTNGGLPSTGTLLMDTVGDLFGVTAGGGASSEGTAFEIAKTANGYASAPTTLATFSGANGNLPYSGLYADASGNLFGTTFNGGANADGTAFELTNTNFVVGPITIAGTVANQAATDAAVRSPFAAVTVTDPTAGQTETVTVTQSATANGVLSDPNAATDGFTLTGQVATLSGTAAQVTADLDALVFTPTAHQVPPGMAVTTGFTITITDTAGSSTSDALTSVVATAANTPPVIGGLPSSESSTTAQASNPFAAVTITDPDNGAIESSTIYLYPGYSEGSATDAYGTLSGAGLSKAGTGTYTLAANTPALEQAALQALVFTPSPQGGSVFFELVVSDGTASVGAGTRLTVSQVASPPTLGGIPASQSTTDNRPIQVFDTVTITDSTPGAQDGTTIQIRTDGTQAGVLTDADGVLAGTGLTKVGVGLYTLAAATPATEQAELEALIFTPTLHQVPSGQQVTPSFNVAVADTLAPNAPATANTLLTVTAQNTQPRIAGLPATEASTAAQTSQPFATTTITDPDNGAVERSTIYLFSGADQSPSNTLGTLSGPGLTDSGGGVYTLAANTPSLEQAALQQLVFTPAPQGGSVRIFLSVTDGIDGNSATTTLTITPSRARRCWAAFRVRRRARICRRRSRSGRRR